MSPPIRAAGHDKALQAALAAGVLQVSPFSFKIMKKKKFHGHKFLFN